jgi:hypothetical protein
VSPEFLPGIPGIISIAGAPILIGLQRIILTPKSSPMVTARTCPAISTNGATRWHSSLILMQRKIGARTAKHSPRSRHGNEGSQRIVIAGYQLAACQMDRACCDGNDGEDFERTVGDCRADSAALPGKLRLCFIPKNKHNRRSTGSLKMPKGRSAPHAPGRFYWFP